MSNTLRNNVLFGLPYDQEWYDAVVSACSLDQDLVELPNNDLTIIGDKGVNLSGGQKARVGLARALYTKAHIMLLDDPLSAVDSHVGNILFNEAVCCESLFEKGGSAPRKRIVILVTHQILVVRHRQLAGLFAHVHLGALLLLPQFFDCIQECAVLVAHLDGLGLEFVRVFLSSPELGLGVLAGFGLAAIKAIEPRRFRLFV